MSIAPLRRDLSNGKNLSRKCKTALALIVLTTGTTRLFRNFVCPQFENTLQLMEKVKFDQLNTAAYSPRPHTPAALWDNQVITHHF